MNLLHGNRTENGDSAIPQKSLSEKFVCAIFGSVTIVCLIMGSLRAAQPGGADFLRGEGAIGGLREAKVQLSAELKPAKQVPGHRVILVTHLDISEGSRVYADKERFAITVQTRNPDKLTVTSEQGPLGISQGEKARSTDEITDYYGGETVLKNLLRIGENSVAGKYELIVNVDYQACRETVCYRPSKKSIVLNLQVLSRDSEPVPVPSIAESAGPKQDEISQYSVDWYAKTISEGGVLVALALGFVAGLLLSLTPCVYPMIPVTVTLIGAASTDRKLSGFLRSLVYVLGISITYATLGLIAAAVDQAFGTVFQNAWVYLFLTVIFVVLAAAMFGAFNIQLQSSTVSRLQQWLRGRWGLVGLLLLGAVSGVVLTPCAAPVILGALILVRESGDWLLGFLSFFAIAWGMGVPLIIAGTFSGLLSSLPKSGAWQTTITKIFGWGLIGAAIYFFAKSAVFSDLIVRSLIAIYLLAMSVFVGAFDRLTPESKFHERARKFVGLIILLGAAFWFVQANSGTGGQRLAIDWEADLSRATAKAKKLKKPMMIYFSQKRCASCRKLESKSFTDKQVVAESDRFVCVKIDATDFENKVIQQLVKTYDVGGFPTLVFVPIGDDPKESRQILGYVGPTELLEAMRRVNAVSGTK
ncbi:MAG: thioredoxin family protein [Planctomycetes bacterium]|nr:thioredoxin family protein [Planctomycetota bacterium]